MDYSFGSSDEQTSAWFRQNQYTPFNLAARQSGRFPSCDAGYRPDRYTAGLALEYVEREKPKFLFVSLGDADEYGHRSGWHHIRLSYREYLDAVHAQDAFIGDLNRLLGTLGVYGQQTTVVVTADHGRNLGFSGHGEDQRLEDETAGRSWIVAAGGAIRAQGIVQAHRAYQLQEIAPSVAALAHLPNAAQPAAIVEFN